VYPTFDARTPCTREISAFFLNFFRAWLEGSRLEPPEGTPKSQFELVTEPQLGNTTAGVCGRAKVANGGKCLTCVGHRCVYV
jgi:hypothetical protein